MNVRDGLKHGEQSLMDSSHSLKYQNTERSVDVGFPTEIPEKKKDSLRSWASHRLGFPSPKPREVVSRDQPEKLNRGH